MKPTPCRPEPWPPLILGAHLPAWLRWRDAVLTLAAWALLGYLMRDTLHLVRDYLSAPVFEFSSAEPPDWRELWGRLRPFMGFVAALTLWLLCWALLRGRAMRATAPVPPPPPLEAARQAAAFDLDATTLADWSAARVLVVHFGADGRIDRGEARPLD